jgi:mannose-6-phosphate isomerase-like protein (cupin superfamily)
MTETMRAFSYTRPAPGAHPKQIVRLCATDLLKGDVQVVRDGGENNLHSHSGTDGFWFVLAGRVRFYRTETTVAAELGRHEGILVPRGVQYWFESVGPEPLELLHVAGRGAGLTDERRDHLQRRRAPGEQVHSAADADVHRDGLER